MFKVLLGLLLPKRGEVRILGRKAKQGRRYVGYVPQVGEFDREFPINVWSALCFAAATTRITRRLRRQYAS